MFRLTRTFRYAHYRYRPPERFRWDQPQFQSGNQIVLSRSPFRLERCHPHVQAKSSAVMAAFLTLQPTPSRVPETRGYSHSRYSTHKSFSAFQQTRMTWTPQPPG